MKWSKREAVALGVLALLFFWFSLLAHRPWLQGLALTLVATAALALVGRLLTRLEAWVSDGGDKKLVRIMTVLIITPGVWVLASWIGHDPSWSLIPAGITFLSLLQETFRPQPQSDRKLR